MRKKVGPADPIDPVLKRRLGLARWVLTWEAAWPLLWPAPSLLLLFAALALLDVLPRLPGWLHAGILVLLVGGLAWSLGRLRRLRSPSLEAARRRVEEDSGLSHHPLAMLADRLALGRDDPLSCALWQAQRVRMKEATRHLSVKPPRPVLARHDPLGLRFVSLGLFLIALAGSPWPDAGNRFLRALEPSLPRIGGPAPILQVWITPPAYTHLAPMLLDSTSDGKRVSLPEGSVVLAEIQGGSSTATLHVDQRREDFKPLGPGSQRLEATLTAGSKLAVHQGFRTVASWPIVVVKDQTPSVVLSAPPAADSDGRLKLAFEAHDDYGIAKVWAVIRRADQSTAEPLRVDLPLGGDHPKDVRQDARADLTGHPWAGLPVTIALGTEDDAGHQAFTAAAPFVLPERHFTHPVARAIITERRRLIAGAGQRTEIAGRMRAIALAHDAYGGDITVFLALIDASARLVLDHSGEARSSVIDMLWQAALKVEDGDRPASRLALDEAARELKQALAEGAPAAEIERLTNQLQQAMERYLQALTAQAQRQGIEPTPASPDAPVISAEELKAMVEQMRDLSRTGSNAAANQMLSRLQSLLDGLESSLHAPASAQAAREAKQRLDELNGIARDQQGLLDETFHRNQQAQPDQALPPVGAMTSPGGREGRRMGRSGPDAGSSRPTSKAERNETVREAQRQEELRQRLGRLMESLDAMGIDIPSALGQAGQAMGDAGEALGANALDDAVDAQSEALARLQEGARASQKAMAERLGSGLVAGGGRREGRDPLGRPGMGAQDDGSVVIPKQADMQKAREVLDELRRRASEPQRPAAERDYLRRLLRSFF